MKPSLRPLVAVLACCPAAALACPDAGLWGKERYEVSASDLYAPKEATVIAGGDIDLRSCRNIRPQNWSGPITGHVIREPDFSITVRGLDGYQIEFRTVSACDSVLLINTAAGNWYFDDDDNTQSAGDALIRLTRPSGDGIYDIWVGTFDGAECEAKIVLETF